MPGHSRRISVTGLGYVGLPVAVAFGRQAPVVAFDARPRRIAELQQGHDASGEVSNTDLAAAKLLLTDRPQDLAAADFHIVAVPTPVRDGVLPDLSPLQAASRTIGKVLKRGDIVVFESTVYPGATEEDCVPLLETESGLVFGRDFTVGYSPERINPGDREHRFETITKVVSGSDPETLELVARVYQSVIKAGVHRAPSIRIAEAAKVIENTQRDINIALMNELSLIFHRLGLDTQDVLEAARTKWNFLPFVPGLVGGHCIGVDPYYLTHRAQRVGYHPEIILAGRRINDGMGHFVAQAVVRHLLRIGAQKPTVTILGLTFKQDVDDIRNSRVVDIIAALQDLGVDVQVIDPKADKHASEAEHGIFLSDPTTLRSADAVVAAVGHAAFRQAGWTLIKSLLKEGRGFVADVPCMLDRDTKPDGIELWRL